MRMPSQPSEVSRTAQSAMGFFNAHKAEQYERRAKSRGLWAVEGAAVADMMLDVPAGARVLDVPVGTGRFIPLYAERSYDVVGLDVSPHMIELAKAVPESAGMSVRLGNIFATGEPDASFDCTVAVRIMHLIEHSDFVLALRELQRVTRGKIVMTLRLGADHDARRGPARARMARGTTSIACSPTAWCGAKARTRRRDGT